jgi:hypothetical protein
MNDPHFKLTPVLQQQICAYIRAGGFPDSSAEALGVPAEVFRRWLRYGQSKRPNPLYRGFLLAVREAQAHARVQAEMRAHQDRPLEWLKNGPGKETDRLPGWTSPVKPAQPKKRGGGLSLQRTLELCQALLQALTPYPEAREAAAEALHKSGWLRDDPDAPPEAVAVVSPAEPESQAQPRDNPAGPADHSPTSTAPPAPPPPVMETKCFDVAPARLPTCPQVSVKAAPTRGEPAVNPERTHKQGTTAARSGEETPREKPRKTGPGPWDPLDAGHWIVFSSP